MPYTTINKPNLYFDTQLWTGTNASGRTFTGLNFRPDFIYNKCYNSANYYLNMVDIVRGGTKFLATPVNSTEDTASHGQITSFNSNGTTWADGTNATYPRLYYNDGAGSALGGSEYVSWNWLANGTGVSNTQGSITSTVSANPTAGFSIVTYTGAGGASTVGHGLGVIPRMIILKGRSNARIWVIGHGSLGWTKYMSFDTAAAQTNNYWNDTTPTSSVFSIFNSVNVNGSGETYVAYCFTDIKGYSKFGSYVGNGNANGTFVYTGFKPAFIMYKNTATAGTDWVILDVKRDPYNVATEELYANLPNAEGTAANNMDILSNGFKPRRTNASVNESGATIIYMAFAENPFVSSTQIPTTAR